MTADVRENRPKMKLDNNRIFGNVISFPDGLLENRVTMLEDADIIRFPDEHFDHGCPKSAWALDS
jgi:hypothetical protein